MTDQQGVIYMAWGDNAISQAKQSIESLRRFAPRMPVLVVGDMATQEAFAGQDDVQTAVCDTDPFDHDRNKGFKFLAGRIKPLLYKISPFERTLYVDADTYFQKGPAEGFRLLDKWDIALAETETRALIQGVAGRDECVATADELGTGLLLYHNSGMIFWRRNERTEALFKLWSEEWQRFGGWDEQVALLRALLRSDAVYLTLPYTWNHSDLKNCYMLSHWFGAGDARFDMAQRARDLRQQKPSKKSLSPMIKVEIAEGQFVQCRAEHEAEVRKMYGLDVGEKLVKEINKMRKDNPLVKVMNGRPGEYVKMRKKDAEAQGLDWEYEKPSKPENPAADFIEQKTMPADENKMMGAEGNKGRPPMRSGTALERPDAAQLDTPMASHLEMMGADGNKASTVDFTEISGIGPATDKQLHEHGIHTFDDLKTAEINFLSGRVVKAIEKWRTAKQSVDSPVDAGAFRW